MKKVLKFSAYIILVPVSLFALFILFSTISDYKPDEKIEVFRSDKPEKINDSLQIKILIWNIGYAGLNAEMDFFYDGGEMVRPEKNIVEENIKAVNSFLAKYKENDFILLQEVDKDAKRSYGINEYENISKSFPECNKNYGKNYDVFFIPMPIYAPMGKVDAGLMTISKNIPSNSTRYSFPGNYSWPKSLFLLDRCFLVNRYPTQNGKELIIINTHNSAYDDGSLKKQQMEYLKTFLEEEFKKGNYIIVGGDWNQCPPKFEAKFTGNIPSTENYANIDSDYLKKWTWLYDDKNPTNRNLSVPYDANKTTTKVIDFYLLSPNIEAVSVKNVNLNFKNSDHNPVEAVLQLR